MADDIRVSEPASGRLVKAKEIGGKLHQSVILYDESGNPLCTVTNPAVISGTVDQGDAGSAGWPVKLVDGSSVAVDISTGGGDPSYKCLDVIPMPAIGGDHLGGSDVPIYITTSSALMNQLVDENGNPLLLNDIGDGSKVLKVHLVDSTGAALGTSGNPLYANTLPTRSAYSSVQTIAADDEDTLLLGANPYRYIATLYNDSPAECYVKFGSGASESSYTVKMLPGAYYEVPTQYSGDIYGCWNTASGKMMVSEVQMET